MALMIPDTPMPCTVESGEDIIFRKLRENLPNDYIVFHSFKIAALIDKQYKEKESDFLVFHPKKGMIFIEAKNGAVKKENRVWYYANGEKIDKEGPYRQAEDAKWLFFNYLKYTKTKYDYLLNSCKLLHAVWFPAVNRDYIKDKLGPNETFEYTLTKESLSKENMQKDIDLIFDTQPCAKVRKTTLTEVDAEKLIYHVLCPVMKATVTVNDLNEVRFNRLLDDQIRLLDFVEDTASGAISGLAGTGKTMIALEKAKRHAENGEDVLFLCYNTELAKFLEETQKTKHIKFMTIAGYAMSKCGKYKDYHEDLIEYLNNNYENFPYKHIIVDEGQDFDIKDAEILKMFWDIVFINDDNNGSFFIFYDENQKIQSETIPELIQKADCKIILHKNCRNTENIAKTSTCLIGQKIKMKDGTPAGRLPRIIITPNIEEQKEFLDKVIEQSLKDENKSIVILTCKAVRDSLFQKYLNENGFYKFKNKEIKFTTVKKFKGLEASSVVLVDVDKEILESKDKIFYTGTSRARQNLFVVFDFDEQDCKEFLTNNNFAMSSDIKKSFSKKFNSFLQQVQAEN